MDGSDGVIGHLDMDPDIKGLGDYPAAQASKTSKALILLDTNALIWWATNHRRSGALRKWQGRTFVSPVSLLEIRFLVECGRARLHPNVSLAEDPRWFVDDPSTRALFEEAESVSWTRDPFDRLIVAHARMRNWKLATADAMLIERLGPSRALEL